MVNLQYLLEMKLTLKKSLPVVTFLKAIENNNVWSLTINSTQFRLLLTVTSVK
jgi:hypothetical protein